MIGSPYFPSLIHGDADFIEARDDRFLNRLPGAKTKSAGNSAHLTGLAWINSQERKPFSLCGNSRTACRRPTGYVFCPKLKPASTDNCY